MPTMAVYRKKALKSAKAWAERGDWAIAQGYVNLACLVEPLSQQELDTLNKILGDGYKAKKRKKEAAEKHKEEELKKLLEAKEREKEKSRKRTAANKRRRLNLAEQVLDIVKDKNPN